MQALELQHLVCSVLIPREWVKFSFSGSLQSWGAAHGQGEMAMCIPLWNGNVHSLGGGGVELELPTRCPSWSQQH